MAERQGLMLRKSKRRDPRAIDYGSWWLVDAETNSLAAPGENGLTLDQVEAWLTDDQP